MKSTIDYYAILGVLPEAEDFIIQAAYRALCKRYHPDVYKGADASERMAAINEAYEILGNQSKRDEYDDNRRQSKEADSEFFNEDFDAEDEDFDPLHEDWKVALEYYPELVDISNRLSQISSRLSFSFKVYIIQEKKYINAEEVATRMKNSFLEQFFGENKRVHGLVMHLISMKRKDILLELNKAIKALGASSSGTIIKQLKSKYRIDGEDYVNYKHYQQLVRRFWPKSVFLNNKEVFELWEVGEISDLQIKHRVRNERIQKTLKKIFIGFLIYCATAITYGILNGFLF